MDTPHTCRAKKNGKVKLFAKKWCSGGDAIEYLFHNIGHRAKVAQIIKMSKKINAEWEVLGLQ